MPVSLTKMKVAFFECLIWSILTPYLVWQQWSGWLALALCCWWMYFYWAPLVKFKWELYRSRKEAENYPALIVSEPEVGLAEEYDDEELDGIIDYNDDPKDNL